MVLQCSLKWLLIVPALGPLDRPSSAITHALTGNNWKKPQSDLQMVATHAGLRGVWKRSNHELMLTASNARLGTVQQDL